MRRKLSKTMRGFAAARGLREVTRQAEADLERGLQDTECRGAARNPDSPCPPRRSGPGKRARTG
ncbi:MAG: hypothetical protein ACT4P3_22095 [Betaproteobacteria bacterium]